MRLVSMSSATRMVAALEGLFLSTVRLSMLRAAWDGGASAREQGMATVKMEPLPSSLETEMEPAHSSARFLQMERPRPVPWYLRARGDSACVKGANIFSSASRGMPMPVSLTRRTRVPRPSPEGSP
jgi:hypothetical protein